MFKDFIIELFGIDTYLKEKKSQEINDTIFSAYQRGKEAAYKEIIDDFKESLKDIVKATEIEEIDIDDLFENTNQSVHCKDCRYRNGKINDNGFEICDVTGMDITDADFCSWAEKRKGGAE